MVLAMPYFMTNKDWYYYDEEESIFKLTNNATQEAIKSYEEYYSTQDDGEFI